MSELKEIILQDESYLKTLLIDINNAKKSIDLEVYIFGNDSTAKQVADTLCNAAKKGIKIRVLVDGVGSTTWGGEITTEMELAGIETRIFHPLPWKFLHWRRSTHLPPVFIKKIFYLLSRLNYRNHRKVCIIDNEIVYVGSANINNHLSCSKNHKAWRETTVKLINVATDEIQYAFDRAWSHFSIKKHLYAIYKNTFNSIFHLNYSWRLRRQYHKQLMQRISACKTRIWITNSYFVPDNRLLKKLKKASKRGVDVKILLPSKSDIFLISMISNLFYSSLLKNGVSIFEFLPTILHAKILILDDWYAIGSSNLNYRSFLHDLEIDVEIRTQEAQKILDVQFLSDINQSDQIKYEDLKKQPFYKKLFGHLILLFRYWL